MTLLRQALYEARHYLFNNFEKHWLNNLRHANLQRILYCSRTLINIVNTTLLINKPSLVGIHLSRLYKTLVHLL